MGLLETLVNIVAKVLGLTPLIKRWDSEPWLAALLVACIVGTMYWMYRAWGCRPLSAVSKKVGGVFAGIINIMFGIAVMFWATQLLINMGAGMLFDGIGGGLSKLVSWIPIFGEDLGASLNSGVHSIGNWALGIFMDVIFLIIAGIYILKNLIGFVKDIAGRLEGSIKDNAGTGPHGAKWSHILYTSAFFAAMLCRPDLNDGLLYIPAVLSGLTGLGFFVYSTATGKKLVDTRVKKTTLKYSDKPGPDGEWLCKNLVYKHDPKTGNIFFTDRTQAHYSKLPKLLKKGKEPVLVPCHTLNEGDDAFCCSAWCDHPNPFQDWDCPDCDKRGLKYDTPKCKACGSRQPKRPVKTAPTTPDTDKHSRPKKKEAPKKVAKGKEVTPSAQPSSVPPQQGYPQQASAQDVLLMAMAQRVLGGQTPIPPVPPQGAPVRQCSKGHVLEANAAFCQVCGEPVLRQARAAAAPPPTPAAPPAPPPPPDEEDEEDDMDSMLFH